MKRENKRFLWFLIGDSVLMVFALLFFGDVMDSLQKFIGSNMSEYFDSSKIIGFVQTIVVGYPVRQYEKYFTEGCMLFLSLYLIVECLSTKSELYQRCHETGDIVIAGLDERV